MNPKQKFLLEYTKTGIKNVGLVPFVFPGLGNTAGIKNVVGGPGTQTTQRPVSPSGNVQSSSAIGYDSGVGWWIGFDKGIPKLFIGNSAGNKILWDGNTLTIEGNFIIGQLSITAHPGDNLQDAIDILTESGGGTLYLTTGTFHVNYNIVMTSNTRIIGVGSGGSIIDFGGGAHQIQAIGTLGNEIISPFLQGFTVQNSSTDLVRVDFAINLGTNDLTSDTGLSGLNITNTVTANIYSSLQNNCATGLIATDTTFFTLFSSNTTNSTSGGGVVLTRVSNSVSIACSVDACIGGGYIFNDCSNFGFENFSITNITGIGLDINGNGNGLSITIGFIDSSTSDGIKIHNSATGIQLTASNTISNNGGYGVNIEAGIMNTLIVADTFDSNTSGAVNDLGTGTLIRSNIGVADN